VPDDAPEPMPQDRPDADDRIEFIAAKKGGISLRVLGLLIGLLIVVDVLAILFLPPMDTGRPEADCAYPACFVQGTIHFPRPHEIWVAGGEEAAHGLMTFQVSVTDALATMIGITILVLLVAILATRGRAHVPGLVQNFTEWAYESMSSWSIGMGGARAGRYIPIFAAFFILILAFNWSGLTRLAYTGLDATATYHFGPVLSEADPGLDLVVMGGDGTAAGAGRFYGDGLAAVKERHGTYFTQADLPQPDPAATTLR